MGNSVVDTGKVRHRNGVREVQVEISESEWDEDGTHLGTTTTWEWRKEPGRAGGPREVYSRFRYVRSDTCVFGPCWGDWTDITPLAREKGQSEKGAVVQWRHQLLLPSDVKAAHVIMNAKGLKGVRTICVTVYRRKKG